MYVCFVFPKVDACVPFFPFFPFFFPSFFPFLLLGREFLPLVGRDFLPVDLPLDGLDLTERLNISF